jgi:hypothetical protein
MAVTGPQSPLEVLNAKSAALGSSQRRRPSNGLQGGRWVSVLVILLWPAAACRPAYSSTKKSESIRLTS